ncbi:MAG TPA: hypothetical protein VEJ44_03880 [Acidimicrobiales bacterium]|nr:hypothetical protein [Acidimicrobiales bacterium]
MNVEKRDLSCTKAVEFTTSAKDGGQQQLLCAIFDWLSHELEEAEEAALTSIVFDYRQGHDYAIVYLDGNVPEFVIEDLREVGNVVGASPAP